MQLEQQKLGLIGHVGRQPIPEQAKGGGPQFLARQKSRRAIGVPLVIASHTVMTACAQLLAG